MRYIITSFESFINEKLSSNDIDNFTNLKNFSDRKKYADQKYKLIGKGSGRYVYNINDEYVLKLAKNNKGIEQNKTEIFISNTNRYNTIIANITEYDPTGLYLIQQKADKITDQTFQTITSLQLQGFLYYLRHDMKWDGKNPDFYNKVNSLIVEFGLDRFDIANESSWGILNNRVVLIDYGLDMNTARKLYKVQY